MRESLIQLGSAIRKARKNRKLTLQELAEKTDLTAGLLSKIENFRTIPSLPVLAAIAGALEVDLAELFRGMKVGKKADWLLVRSGERKTVEREENRNLRYGMILEAPLAMGSMQFFSVRIPSGAEGGDVTTEADELLYLLKGKIRYRIGKESVPMEPGDALFFNGRLPHGPEKTAEDADLLAFYFLREPEN